MIKNHPRVYKENFTQNGVPSRHFVTLERDCVQAEVTAEAEPLAVVQRCYQPEKACVEALVEALYRLIVDGSHSKQGSTCFCTSSE